MCVFCNGNSGFCSCSKLRKIILLNDMKLCEYSSLSTCGLTELYGKDTMDKVFKLINRLRKIKGYVYIFKGVGADAYKRKSDLPENIFSSFKLNPISGFYEFDMSQGKLLSA